MQNLQETYREKSSMHCEERCPMCATVLRVIWIHGHGQCATCEINVDHCCGGAPLNQAQIVRDVGQSRDYEL